MNKFLRWGEGGIGQESRYVMVGTDGVGHGETDICSADVVKT